METTGRPEAATDAAAVAARWSASDLPEWRLYGHVLAGDLALQQHDVPGALRAYAEAEHHGSSWILHEARLRAARAGGDVASAARELAWCEAHRGEIAVFLTPSLSLVRELRSPGEAPADSDDNALPERR